MIDFLVEKGFHLMAYDDHGNDMRLVQIIDFIMEESSIEKAKKCLIDYVRPIDLEVAEWMLNNPHLINSSFIEFIPRIKPDFLEDDINTAYYPFTNGVIKITKDDITMIPYGNLKKHIWKSAKIDFDISIESFTDQNGEISWDSSIDYFPEFIWCISGKDNDR